MRRYRYDGWVMGKHFNTHRLRALATTGTFLAILILTNAFTAFVHAAPGDDFTIVVLPDTQYYSELFPDIFYSQTQWIVENKDAQKIVYTAHLGDIVENASVVSEWQIADIAMYALEDPFTTNLDDGIPYGVLPGNHDQPTNLYNQYFDPARFLGRNYYGGSYAVDNNDNNFTLFSAGGLDFIVINLAHQAALDPDVLDWADDLLKSWSARRAIVVAHNALSVGLNPNDPGNFTVDGQLIFDALKDNPNLFLILCGHNGTEEMRTDIFNGNTIYTLLSNYQGLANGGSGWLRYMTFSPLADTITVTTYSPWLNDFGSDNPDLMGSFTISAPFNLTYDMSSGPTSPPTEPTGFSATAGLSTQVDLNWTDNSDDEAGYQIEWSVNGGVDFSHLGTVAPDTENYSHEALMADTEYCYRIRATNGAGPSSYTTVQCATTLPGPTIVTFIQGVGGYADMIDTSLLASAPNLPNGDNTWVGWDTDNPYGSGYLKYGLIRFDNIIGSGISRVPLGATIQTATLSYVVENAGVAGDVNEVTIDWDEAVTYDSFGGEPGVQPDEYGASVGTAFGSPAGVHSLDVTSSLVAWVNNPSVNHGWIFRPTDSDGVDFWSSEVGPIDDRPTLTVAYSLHCNGDFEPTDGDVDGADLFELVADPGKLDLITFSADFGKVGCN